MIEFKNLWEEADAIWEQNLGELAFEGYVSADYPAVYDQLRQLQGRIETVLEWGSGLGVITSMASQMGFEAFGIEAEPLLVDYSEALAVKFAPDATFVVGSFIPDDFEWMPMEGDSSDRTDVDAPAAYDQIDREICDFDLIYAYPWPEEHQLFRNIFFEFARPGGLLLTYDRREGLEILEKPTR